MQFLYNWQVINALQITDEPSYSMTIAGYTDDYNSNLVSGQVKRLDLIDGSWLVTLELSKEGKQQYFFLKKTDVFIRFDQKIRGRTR